MLPDITTSIYALKMLRPGQISPLPPWLRFCIQDRIISLLKVIRRPTAKYIEVEPGNQATKTVILTYTSKQKPSLNMQRNVEPSAIFSRHSIQSYATLPVANVLKP